MPAQLIKPDSKDQTISKDITVFLAGTIDNGNSEDWQTNTFEILKNDEVCFINPRREKWNSTLTQDITNPDFNYQVNWELDNIRDCSIVFCFIGGKSLSPITLMELGWLSAHNQYNNPIPTIVVCEDSFWRKGNVEVIASRTNQFFLFSNMDDGITQLRKQIACLK